MLYYDFAVIEILKRIRHRLSDITKWKKSVWAESRDGHLCLPTSENAVVWDVLGAILKETPDNAMWKIRCEVYSRINTVKPSHYNSIEKWEAQATHQEVLQVLDNAILV